MHSSYMHPCRDGPPSNKRLLQSRQPSGSRASLAVRILDAQQKHRSVRPKDEWKTTTETEAPMSSIKESAEQFFDACETEQGLVERLRSFVLQEVKR